MSTVCIEAPWVDPFLIVAMENVPAPFTSTDELICGWFSHNGADWTGRRVLSWAWEKHVLNVHERESLVVVGLWLMVSGCLTRLIYHAPTEQASKLSADSEPGQNAGAFVPRKKKLSLLPHPNHQRCTVHTRYYRHSLLFPREEVQITSGSATEACVPSKHAILVHSLSIKRVGG